MTVPEHSCIINTGVVVAAVLFCGGIILSSRSSSTMAVAGARNASCMAGMVQGTIQQANGMVGATIHYLTMGAYMAQRTRSPHQWHRCHRYGREGRCPSRRRTRPRCWHGRSNSADLKMVPSATALRRNICARLWSSRGRRREGAARTAGAQRHQTFHAGAGVPQGAEVLSAAQGWSVRPHPCQ